jgi:hypothetical protein
MPIEKLRELAIGQELNQKLQTAVFHVLTELEEEVIGSHPKRFTPLAAFVFGSLLDVNRFEDKSDFDILVIIAENFYADDFRLIGLHCSPSDARNLVLLRHYEDEHDGWGCCRDVDVIVMSEDNLKWEISRVESLTDAETAILLADDVYLTSLASGITLFNRLNDSYLKNLLRLSRVYTSTNDKRNH